MSDQLDVLKIVAAQLDGLGMRDSGSEIQRRDVEALLSSVGDLDRGYVERWAGELGVLKTWREVSDADSETDTPTAVDALFRRRLMERSGAERLRMACDMFDAATALIVASLPPEVAADPAARRVAILQRMYWPERNEPFMKSAVARLMAQSGNHCPPEQPVSPPSGGPVTVRLKPDTTLKYKTQ